MKKLLLYLLLPLIFITSCANQKDNEKNITKPIIKPIIKLETFITNFLDSNQNWNQNDVIRDRTNKKFRHQLEASISNGLLEDFPLVLDEINEYSSGKFAANFETYYTKNTIDYNSILYGVNFNLIGLIDKKLVETLKEDKAYYIKGSFKKFLYSDFRDYINGMVYTPLVGFSTGSLGIETNMGTILMKVDQVSEAKRL